MSYFLTEEQTLMRNVVREFAQNELKPIAAELDKTSEFPMAIWKRIGELGLAGITAPVEYGGLGAEVKMEMVIMEEIGKVCPAVGLVLNAHLIALGLIQHSQNEDMKKKYLADGASGKKLFAISATDPAGASNIPQWTMFAQEVEDGWVLNGNKVFCTNSHVADVYVCMSLTATGLSNFVVEKGTPGMITGFFEHKIGLRGVNSGSVTYQNVKVPKNHAMDYPQTLKCNVGILDMCMISIGAAETAYEKTVAYLSTRERGGTPLIGRGAISQKLIGILAEIEMCKSFMFTIVELLDAGRPDPRFHPMAKSVVPERMTQCIVKCIELHGAVGYSEDAGLSLLLRDAMGCMIADGSATLCCAQAGQYSGWQTQD